MHTVHTADTTLNGFGYAAMGIMFSVDKSTVTLTKEEQFIVDAFFDSLKWTETSSDPKVAEVPYGDLMMMVNTRDRYVYSGSVTTPPCATKVYWNVLTTIYPLKQSVLDQFKKQMARTPGLEKTGNWRLIQKLDGQNPKIIKGPALAGDGLLGVSDNTALIIFMILFIVTTVMFCAISIYFYNQANSALASKGGQRSEKKEAEFTSIENAETATKKEDGA